MALIDTLNRFANALAVTASGDATNVIDGRATLSQFNGKPMVAVIKIDVAADTASGNETYAFSVTTDDNASLTSDTTVATKTIAGSALTANSLHVIDIPENTNLEQYIGFVHTLGGTTPSVTYTAWLAEKRSLTNLVKFPNGYDA